VASLQLADGRTLAYEEWGDVDGTPVFFAHGTGDSRLARYPDDTLTRSLGLRLITADRPGVGGSTQLRGRSLLDWPQDVAALADELEIERFAIAGWSGGGPHALAAAHLLGDRVTRLVLASPLGPFDEQGSRDLVLNRDLRMIWRLNHARFVATAAARHESKASRRDLRKFVTHLAEEAPADRDVLLDPVLEPMFEEEMGEALVQGGVGVLDDMWAFLDWGFVPEDITQPVDVFYGDADDILAPEMYRRLVQRLGAADTHVWVGGGHYQVFARWAEFLQPLVAGRRDAVN
jgi:pimeloyl-ACP methyl ester carboxylesterase